MEWSALGACHLVGAFCYAGAGRVFHAGVLHHQRVLAPVVQFLRAGWADRSVCCDRLDDRGRPGAGHGVAHSDVPEIVP